MKNTWRHFFRRLAAMSAISVATAWSSAMCYAVQLAYDTAADPVYADGWHGTTTNNSTGVQETTGDNGGFGFEPWNFDTDWLFNPDPIDGIQAIDSSSAFNQIGTSWRMATPVPVSGVSGLPRAGRGFAPLQVGQTIRVVFDNPTEEAFFKGYFIRFNSRDGEAGGGNICYDFPGYSTACSAASAVPIGATPTPKLVVQRFEYFDDGQWVIINGANPESHPIPLFDLDTAAAGAQLDLTLTGPDTYQLTIDPFGPAATHTETGTLQTPGEPIDWIEFTFFNTPTNASAATDLYIKSIEILGAAPPGVPGDYNNDGTVNAADYVLWRNGGPLQNEVDNPGTVDAADYTAWRTRFGNTAGSGAGGSTVPEPGGWAYFLAALVWSWAAMVGRWGWFGRRVVQVRVTAGTHSTGQTAR